MAKRAALGIPADLARMDEVERLASEIEWRETRLDILVNNADANASWGEFCQFSGGRLGQECLLCRLQSGRGETYRGQCDCAWILSNNDGGCHPRTESAGLAIPMKRGLPEDIAGVAIYLASKASGSVCRAVIPVDGGFFTPTA
jgi:NAD(P)-dependent dehydrogenase (short-subunit alcohol dehydrogenase family)